MINVCKWHFRKLFNFASMSRLAIVKYLNLVLFFNTSDSLKN